MTRMDVREALRQQLVQCDAVLAMWEAGSTAFGRDDAYSDLDIGVLARAGSNNAVWSIVDQAFEGLGGVALRWHEANPLFSGLDKRVFRPRKADRWLQVDVGIFSETTSKLYNEPERHGRIVIMFDRAGRLAPKPLDQSEHQRCLREALHQNIMKWKIYHGQFRKELARGRSLDAFAAYYGLALHPLVAVLGMRYRPNRWDFGFRYLKEDLPADVVNTLTRLCFVSDPSRLEEKFIEADHLFRATVETLAHSGITPVDSRGVDIQMLDANN